MGFVLHFIACNQEQEKLLTECVFAHKNESGQVSLCPAALGRNLLDINFHFLKKQYQCSSEESNLHYHG